MKVPPRFAARLIWAALGVLTGISGALAQAPFQIAPLILLMMGVAFALLERRRTVLGATALGWLIGLGYFMLSLHWIVEPFQINAAAHAWMAPFAIVLMGAGMALFWALAFGLARLAGSAKILLLTWPLVELLRAYIFTGFPWATPAQALVNVIAGQGLAFVGPYGLMVLMCAGAYGVLWLFYRMILGHLIFATLLLGLTIVPPLQKQTPLSDTTLRLVQPNIAQADKWNPEKTHVILERLLEGTRADPPVDLVVWPETSLPFLAHNTGGLFQTIGQAAKGAPVVLGILRQEDEMIFNSVLVLDAQGDVTATYDKHHLVPFGEYIPFRAFFSALGLKDVADIFGEGFGVGAGAQLLDFGTLGRALPLICYEAVFAHDVNAAPERPDFLLHLTNDAWFGDFAGPHQHLAQAQMRAIEQGLPLARAANTGISAMIDPYGRIIQQLDLNAAGTVDAALPQVRAATFYSYTGDLPLFTLLLLGLLGACIGSYRFKYV